MEHPERFADAESHEDHGHGETESIIIKRMAAHEKLAQEMKKSGIDCSALPLGSHKMECEETYYSHVFALTSSFVTNKGLIEIRGKNIDYVQVLQRN